MEISWGEAIDTIVAALERVRDKPKKLWVQAWDVVGDNMFWLSAFGSAFGSCHVNVASSPTCGKVVHPVEFFSGCGFHQQPDLHYANYCILIGTQFGVVSRGSFNHHLLDMAEARARGMKLVVIDPVGGFAASKANEWVPIRPGTDAAFGLSMLQVLLNELAIYDAPFLKSKTNAPYLIGPDGKVAKKARLTLRHNGVAIHDNVEIPGPTGGARNEPEGTPGPLTLQGHGNPLQFRNIWIVEKK